MSLANRIDATCVATATVIAGCGALGFSPEWFPMEHVGIAADLGAGLMAAKHALKHRLHREKPEIQATVSISTDGAGRVIWSK